MFSLITKIKYFGLIGSIPMECLPQTTKIETNSRTDEGQPRPKYIFNKCGTNINFFTLQKFGPSPSPNFKSNCIISICWQLGLHTSNFTSLGYLIQVKPMLETNLNV